MTPAESQPPMIVVEGSEEAFQHAVGEVRSSGCRVTGGFDGPPTARVGDVRVGTVASSEDAAHALLAVLAGAGVVVHGLAARDVLDRLLGDLRHVGRVEHRRGAPAPQPTLDDDARGILRCLAEGLTLGEAASRLGMSRRTADRRLSEARRVLGTERTVEAVARARRLGWLG